MEESTESDGGPRSVRNRRPTPGPSAMKTRGPLGVETPAKQPNKKSVRWLNDEEEEKEEEEEEEEENSRKIFGLYRHPLVVMAVAVVVVMMIFAIDFGELARHVERFSRLVVPGFCLALAVGRLSQHLEADDRKKLRIFAMLLGACISAEAALCLSAGEDLPPWVYSLVVFVAIAAVGFLSSSPSSSTSSSVGHVVVVVPALTVIAVRYAACVLFETTSLPRPWRPLLGNAFAVVGMVTANAGFVRSELMRLAGKLGSRQSVAAVNHVRQQTTDDVSDADDRANRLARNRRISLPLIRRPPVGDTLNSHILTKAESTISQLLKDPDVPAHAHPQLQTLSELLKVSATSLMCGRSKSISLVTFSGANVFYQLCSDLPYTISEESSFAPKRIRRHFSVAGFGPTSGLWSHRFFNPTQEPTFTEKHDSGKHSDQLRNGHSSGGSVYTDGSSRTPGEENAQDDSNSEELSSRKTSFASHRSSLRFSSAEKDEVFGRESNDVASSHSEPEVESEAVRRLLDEAVFSQWNYPIFELASEAPDRILSKVAHKIFTELQLMSAFEIPEKEFVNFFQAIEGGYRNNPYHNRIHATDVLHAVYYMTTQQIYGLTQVIPTDDYGPKPRMTSLLSSSTSADDVSGGKMGANFLALELMAMLTAAALHDYDHPGRTNAFLIATCHPLAVLYNNRSVLENHHAAASWGLLISDPKYAWLVNLNDAEFKRFRYLVIEEILVTDLVQHFTIVTDFRNKFLSGVNSEDNFLGDSSAASQIDWTSEDHRLVVSRMVNKMADINGPCKNWELHKQWTDRIVEEFYRQGDDERLIQASVSPYMDRNQPQLAKLQESFITHLVRPLCMDMDSAGLLPCYVPEDFNPDNEEDGVTSSDVICPMSKHLSENYEEWTQRMKSENTDTTETT